MTTAPRQPKRTITVRGTLTVLGFCAVLLLSAFIWWRAASSPESLAAGVYAQLEYAPREDLPARMTQLSILGNPGIQYTVMALAHPRAEVSAAAEAQLRNELARWQLLETKYAAPRVAALADHLHQQLDSFDAEQKQVAAELAAEILVWPLPEDIDASQLILDCEAVLRSQRPTLPADGLAKKDRRPLLDTLEVDPLPLAGGGLPINAVDVPALPPADLMTSQQSPVSEVTPLHRPPEELRLPPAESGAPALLQPSLARQLPDDNTQPNLQPLRVDPDPIRTDELLAGSPSDAAELLQRMSDYRVMQQLHAAGGTVPKDAEAELRSRGFGNAELQLARQMTQPDVVARRRFAEQLPSLVSGDIRPWLVWLTLDSDPNVRLTAATMMATSTDPKLQDELRKLQQRDPDLGQELANLRAKLGR